MIGGFAVLLMAVFMGIGRGKSNLLSAAAIGGGGTGTTLPPISVLKNSTFPDQMLPAGSTNTKIGSYIVKNNTNTTLVITNLSAGLNLFNGMPNQNITNLYFVINGSQIGSTLNNPLPFFTSNSVTASVSMPPLSSKTVDIYATIGASGGSFRNNFFVSVKKNGTGSSTNIDVCGFYFPGINPGCLGQARDGQTVAITGAASPILYVQNTAYPNQTTNSNATAKIASYKVTNNASEPITFSTVNVSFNPANLTVPLSSLTNLKVAVNNSILGMILSVHNYNNLSANFTVNPGVTKTVDVIVNVGNVAEGSIMQVMSGFPYGITGVNSGMVYGSFADIPGQITTTACLCNVSLSTSNPPSATVAQGTTNYTFAKFTIANNCTESKKITGFTIDKQGISNWSSVKNVKLYANGIQVGTTSALPTGPITFVPNFTITNGSTVAFEVRADISNGTAGQTIALGAVNYTQVGVPSGVSSGIMSLSIWGNMMSITP